MSDRDIPTEVVSYPSVDWALLQGERCRSYGPEHSRVENENVIVILADEVTRLRDELERLERERAEWSGTAAQRLRETQMALHERDCAVVEVARLKRENDRLKRYLLGVPELAAGDVPEKHVCSFSYSGGAEQQNCVLCGAPRQGTRGCSDGD